MPFVSAKQREYLRRHEPAVYRKWVREHGTKVVPTAKGGRASGSALPKPRRKA